MTRLFLLTALIIGAGLIVSCSGAPAPTAAAIQPTTAPAAPTVAAPTVPTPTTTTQPTSVPASPTVPPQPTAAQPTKAPTAAAQTATPASSSGQQKLNLDDYLPKGAGRELMLRDCTSCHSFVPIVTGQRPNERWLSLKNDHKDKAAGVSPADYDTEFAYLMENFNNTKPEPKFPDWYMQQQQGIGE